MKMIAGLLLAFVLMACSPSLSLRTSPRSASSLTGSSFYKTVAANDWRQRDSQAVKEILSGNIPPFLSKLSAVSVSMIDSATGQKLTAIFYVTADYLSIGSNEDWARIPMTPMAAQIIADSLDCFLPTRKMVDAIYKSALIKLEPMPMYAFRDSAPTFFHHHLIIEGQRKGREGLIADIKKDVVISGKITRDAKQNRVAIYGWHKPDGKPIQPLYTGHVNWYVDYSHCIRLVYRKIKINNRWMDYTDVLAHPVYSRLLCDEGVCDFYRYNN